MILVFILARGFSIVFRLKNGGKKTIVNRTKKEKVVGGDGG